MKKTGFTLAEILVSLLILGVIASLTIPSLIQNTQKKEEVVKIKKSLSVINQALAANYALTGKDLSDYCDSSNGDNSVFYNELFKKNLSIVDEGDDGWDFVFRTQDGLVYGYNDLCSSDGAYSGIWIITKPYSYCGDGAPLCSGTDCLSACTQGKLGDLTGSYRTVCSGNRCVPTEDTAAIINSVDPTKAE